MGVEIAIFVIIVLVIFLGVDKPSNTTPDLTAELAQERLLKQQAQQKVDELEKRVESLLDANLKVLGQKKSSEVKLGFLAEKLSPFLDNFPYKNESDEITHVGQPFDLFVLRDSEVVVVEIKTNGAKLSTKQKHLQNLIKCGKVRFETHTISDKGYKIE